MREITVDSCLPVESAACDLRVRGATPAANGRYLRSTLSGAHLPRKPNYNFEKQRKEQNRQAKKDAKREEKLRRKQQEELQRPAEPSPEPQ